MAQHWNFCMKPFSSMWELSQWQPCGKNNAFHFILNSLLCLQLMLKMSDLWKFNTHLAPVRNTLTFLYLLAENSLAYLPLLPHLPPGPWISWQVERQKWTEERPKRKHRSGRRQSHNHRGREGSEAPTSQGMSTATGARKSRDAPWSFQGVWPCWALASRAVGYGFKVTLFTVLFHGNHRKLAQWLKTS